MPHTFSSQRNSVPLRALVILVNYSNGISVMEQLGEVADYSSVGRRTRRQLLLLLLTTMMVPMRIHGLV